MPDPKITEQQLNEELEQKKRRDEAYFENVEKRVAETNGIHKKYDTQRYTKKAQMSQLIATWREELKNDSKILQDKTLAKLLKDMETYAAMDITATHSTTIGNVESARRELNEVEKSVKEESKQLTNLAKNVQKYIEELETKSEQHQGIEEETLIARRQVMAQNIQLLVEEQINGYLPEISEDACHIRAKDKNIATMGEKAFPTIVICHCFRTIHHQVILSRDTLGTVTWYQYLPILQKQIRIKLRKPFAIMGMVL